MGSAGAPTSSRTMVNRAVMMPASIREKRHKHWSACWHGTPSWRPRGGFSERGGVTGSGFGGMGRCKAGDQGWPTRNRTQSEPRETTMYEFVKTVTGWRVFWGVDPLLP